MYNRNEIIDVKFIENDQEDNNDSKKDNGVVLTEYGAIAAAVNGIVDVIKESVRCHNEFKSIRESEITKRKMIKANYDYQMNQLNKEYEMKMEILKNNHKNTDDVLNHLHKIIDEYVHAGNNEMVKHLLNTQMDFIKNSQSLGIKLIEENSKDKLIGCNPNTQQLPLK